MRIGITGATGFIGSHFVQRARSAGHEGVLYSRRAGVNRLQQPVEAPWALPEPEQPLEALVHLAGESVFGLWTASKKTRIRDSRVAFTERLVAHVAGWRNPPRTLVVASAVGYYGNGGDAVLEEDSASGEGFLAEVCRGWEAAAQGARDAFGARVVCLRTGLVLGRDGGALPLMRRVFALGGGGRLGSGRQWMPWIHSEDEAGLILFAVEQAGVSGPLNLTAPQPVTNAEFTRELARALHRPAILPVPGWVLETALGAMGKEMLLGGQRAVPKAALAAGYRFAYPELGAALAQLLAQ